MLAGRLQGCSCAGCCYGADLSLQCVACRRVGGAFGGKVARSMPVAAAAAVAAAKTGRRVHYSLNRNDDMRINGGAPVARGSITSRPRVLSCVLIFVCLQRVHVLSKPTTCCSAQK